MYISVHQLAGGGCVAMERFGEYVKKSVLNFKLQQCCWVASVRTGALTLACLNIILGLTVLVEISKGEEASFTPLLLQALSETTDKEEEGPDFIPSCIIAYAMEIASNALVICAMWRNDIVLLRAYLYYALGVLTLAIMIYSVVIGALEVIPELLIVASVGTQLYQIMLVRSAMVEIKNALIKNGYTVNLKPNDKPSPGSNEKYTVSIESEKPKLPPKPVTKGDISKPVIKEVGDKEVTAKEASVTVHSPAKQAFLLEATEEAKERVPSRVLVKEKAKIDRAKPERIEFTKKL
ncbi:uncharacterized protein LOC134671131 [Cydia fagiglandana]|uniref:uncharacterized protein LOC134671131 n=1 Tax=Cydia fagiglandana TaxID=1458189 RepID=UPI002FEDFD0F